MSRARQTLHVTALMALSGGATLAGEVLGARLLRPLLGGAALSQAGAVAGVLGGLGLGATLSAYALSRAAHPRTPRAVLVGAHAALMGFTLFAAPFVTATTGFFARALIASHGALGDLLGLLLGVALTLPAGMLSGAVYPAAVAALGRSAGEGTAWVGSASSFGAAATVLLSAFALAPALGISRTLWVVAALYALCMALARALPPSAESVAPKALSSTVAVKVGSGERGDHILIALGLVGVASTTWQTVLTRVGELSFGPSAYALAAAVAAHVTALGIGELLAVRGVTRAKRPARESLSRWVLLASAAAVCAVPMVLRLPVWSEELLRHGAPSRTALWSVAFGLVTLLAAPVIASLGAAMAYGAQSLAEEGRSSARANALMLGMMAVGNVVGAVLGPWVLMPRVRVEGAMVAVGALLLVAAGLIAKPSTGKAVSYTSVLALIAWRVLLAARADPGAVLNGPFLYAGAQDLDLGRVVWRRDGREATVAVRRDPTGAVLLQINGKVDATSEGDATTQTVLGIVPTAMASRPRDVLVVGLGSGMTADAVRRVPGVERVVVAELVPEVIRAAREDFAQANHGVLRAPGVRVVEADAAHFLRGTRERFDVIVSEPSNPWVAGMSDLFTLETFTAAREALRPGGTMGAWFHAYSTDARTVSAIAATFRAVFPRCALIEISAGQDYLLVGVKDPFALDVDALVRRLEDPGVRAILRASGMDSPAAVVARFLAGSDGVELISQGLEPMRATDLSLEFRAPGLLYHDATTEVFRLFSRVQDLPFAGLGPHGTRWLSVISESEGARDAAVHTRAMVLAEREGDLGRALQEGELAVGLSPEDSGLRTVLARYYLERATRRLQHRDPGGAEEDFTDALGLDPSSPERFRALVGLGRVALDRRDGRRAFGRYTEALGMAHRAGQSAPELRVRRAEACVLLGARVEARRELELAERETRSGARREAIARMRGRL